MDDQSTRADERLGSRAGWTIALLAVVGLLASPTVAAQNATEMRVEASEDCPENPYCFEVTEGNLDEIEPGDTVEITLVNPEGQRMQHNIHLADTADANVGMEEATPEDAAFANSQTIDPGEETTFEAEIPDDVDGIYVWCSVGVHEEQGMFEELQMGGMGDGANGSSAAGVLAAAFAVVVAARIGVEL